LILASCLPDEKRSGVAFCDITTGDFSCGEIDTDQIQEVLLRRETREIVVPESVTIDIQIPLTNIDGYHFIQDIAYKKLLEHFHVVALDGFGVESFDLGISAAGALLYYLEENQKTALPHINRISLFKANAALYLDAATRKNMELFENIGGGDGRTLLRTMDACVTPFGKRMLRRELLEPLTDPEAIQQRLDGVEELKNKDFLRQELRESFKKLKDVERITSRLACQRIMPRELVALKDSLAEVPMIKGLIQECECDIITTIHDRIIEFDDIVDKVGEILINDPPATIDEGGMIKEGYSAELDELRGIAHNGKKWVLDFSETERHRTGISSLKVAYNSVFGYFIEITKPNLHLVPDSYIRKQTLTNSERFYTPELKEFEEKIIGAEEKINALEHDLYMNLREDIAGHASDILDTTRALSMLDILQGFAQNAVLHNYTRPVVDAGTRISIVEGRHPVVENLIEKGSFIPNDIVLDRDKNQILIITGPNMAGKSTYLRQVALIAIMAQVGSYVPAKEAKIGVVDKIFTRIGASDDISRGVSTFLAEMMETANILNNVSDQSLVILDEVGRGTSTHDGLALAWAVVEHLHAHKKPRTLFATHFHELTKIEEFLKGVRNYNIMVKEWGDEIIFLRKLGEGPSDQSYGIHVARLAGLPQSVIERARKIQQDFQEGEVFSVRRIRRAKLTQQDLFMDT
jgi:DNA mismatch repair protein MutS